MENNINVGDSVLVLVPRWIPDSDYPSGCIDKLIPAGSRGTVLSAFSRSEIAIVAGEEDDWEMPYAFSDLERI